MGSWRAVVLGLVGLALAGTTLSMLLSPWLVVPPVGAAGLVLVGAALAVDFFGVARLRTEWSGFTADHRQAWGRAKLLDRRFYRQRKVGSPRTRATARSLLLAYAESGRLSVAKDVIDFLGADMIFSGPGSDSVADAVRAMALTEMDRAEEAMSLLDALESSKRRQRLPVVGYAAARIAIYNRQYRQALERLEQALEVERMPAGARRDLEMLRAACLAHLGRAQDATSALAQLSQGGFRRDVESMTELAHEQGDVCVALAGRSALEYGAPYR